MSITVSDPTCADSQKPTNLFMPSVYSTINRLRNPSEDLIPNLRALRCSTHVPEMIEMSPFTLVAGPGLRKLRLSVRHNPSAYVRHVQTHLSTILDFAIASNCTAADLATCLTQLHDLESFGCTLNQPTTSMFTATAALTNLKQLTVKSEWWNSAEQLVFQVGTFTSLTTLAMAMDIVQWAELIGGGYVPPLLTRLFVEGGTTHQGNATIKRFFTTTATSFPDLRELSFIYHFGAADEVAMTFDDFKPITGCKKLSRLSLRHPCGVDVTEAELENLLTYCRQIQTLRLTYTMLPRGPDRLRRPLQWKPSRLPLTVLDVFSRRQRKIKTLALCLNESSTGPSNGGHGLFDALEDLTSLDITLSSMASPLEVALYLACRTSRRLRIQMVECAATVEVMNRWEMDKKRWKQVDEYRDSFLREIQRLKEVAEEDIRKLQEAPEAEVAA